MTSRAPPYVTTALDHTPTLFLLPHIHDIPSGPGDAQPQRDRRQGERPLAGRGVDALRQPHW
jgi:hypothetical protein